ncbi:MAG: sulfurtransferase TusA family protein [Euryarchaeota archaeon]|nr:sulfurtransferase TusA family protein [Euryarchaeota archaeon]
MSRQVLRKLAEKSYRVDLRDYDDFWLGVYFARCLEKLEEGDVVELLFDDLSAEEGVLMALSKWNFTVLEHTKSGKDVRIVARK